MSRYDLIETFFKGVVIVGMILAAWAFLANPLDILHGFAGVDTF